MFNWRPPVLQTERLRLRPLTESDAQAIFNMCSNPNMTRFTLWDTHLSLDDSLHYVRQYAPSRYAEQVPEPLAIVLDHRSELVGTIGCFWQSQADGVMEVGYNVAEPHWGRGLAVEAATKLIAHCFANYAVDRMQIRIVGPNRASACVARKLGFRSDGVLRSMLNLRGIRRDVEIFSLLRSEA